MQQPKITFEIVSIHFSILYKLRNLKLILKKKYYYDSSQEFLGISEIKNNLISWDPGNFPVSEL